MIGGWGWGTLRVVEIGGLFEIKMKRASPGHCLQLSLKCILFIGL